MISFHWFCVFFYIFNLVSRTCAAHVKEDLIEISDDVVDKLYHKYREAHNDDHSSHRRMLKDNIEYNIHVDKLKEVNGLKKHNLKVEVKTADSNPLIYINNPVESKFPHPYLSLEEFKNHLVRRVQDQKLKLTTTSKKYSKYYKNKPTRTRAIVDVTPKIQLVAVTDTHFLKSINLPHKEGDIIPKVKSMKKVAPLINNEKHVRLGKKTNATQKKLKDITRNKSKKRLRKGKSKKLKTKGIKRSSRKSKKTKGISTQTTMTRTSTETRNSKKREVNRKDTQIKTTKEPSEKRPLVKRKSNHTQTIISHRPVKRTKIKKIKSNHKRIKIARTVKNRLSQKTKAIRSKKIKPVKIPDAVRIISKTKEVKNKITISKSTTITNTRTTMRVKNRRRKKNLKNKVKGPKNYKKNITINQDLDLINNESSGTTFNSFTSKDKIPRAGIGKFINQSKIIKNYTLISRSKTSKDADINKVPIIKASNINLTTETSTLLNFNNNDAVSNFSANQETGKPSKIPSEIQVTNNTDVTVLDTVEDSTTPLIKETEKVEDSTSKAKEITETQESINITEEIALNKTEPVTSKEIITKTTTESTLSTTEEASVTSTEPITYEKDEKTTDSTTITTARTTRRRTLGKPAVWMGS